VRPPLNRDRVIEAAIRVADAEGVDAVTMRRLAEELGVHPTSMYNHIATKDAILDGIAEALIAEARMPTPVDSWADWVRAFAVGIRNVARSHPGAFLVLTQRAAVGPTATEVTEAGLDAFRRAGFSPRAAGQAVSGTSLALLGIALNECPPTAALTDAHLTALSPEQFPRISEAAAAGADQDGVWTLMVDALIIGLAASSAASKPSSRRRMRQ
jgi:AcrR family transcriptional regulator